MSLHVFDRPERRVAFRRHVGPYGADVEEFWRRVITPWLRRDDLIGRPRYGISHDDPRRTAPEHCRYDAGAEVHDGYVAGEGTQLVTLAAGRYAGMAFRGTSAQLAAAWTAVFASGLGAQGLRLDTTRPSFEYYRPESTYDPSSGVFDCEIVLPIAPP